MVLVLSAYYQPFRAVLLGEDGEVKKVLRPFNDYPDADGFYSFPMENMLDAFLKEDVNPYEIKQVVIFGKPLLFFETFLKESLVSPRIKKMSIFGKGVHGYFNNVFRIRKNLSNLLRFTPKCWFLPALGAFAGIRNVFDLDGDILFWEVHSEFSQPFLSRKDSKEIVVLNHLSNSHRRYFESKQPEIRREILNNTLSSLGMEKGYVVVNRINGDDDFRFNGIELIADAPTLAVLGLCRMFLSSDGKAAERQVNFHRSLVELAGVRTIVGQKSHMLALCDLEKLWAESPSFKTLSEHSGHVGHL